MPELPEVETVVRLIRPGLSGRTIVAAEASWERTVGGDLASFRAGVIGARVERVHRRAKYTLFDLTRNGAPAGVVVGHLRMTGRMQIAPQVEPLPPYTRASLALDDGTRFDFLDVRKFGRLLHAAAAEDVLPALGPEPLSDDFEVAVFTRALRARRRILKSLLLDQSFVAGLGNIYVDESLHRVGLHPLRTSDRVTPSQARRLHAAIREVLAEAIEREGSSFDTFYRTPEGQPGSYQHQFQVYGRTGKPCRTCGTTIERLLVGQRGTHVCPRCQPRPRRRRAAARR